VHVYGTSYQMGVAYGQLLYKEINALVPEFFQYVYAQMGACLAVVSRLLLANYLQRFR
jgi:hypothetical protein